MRKGDWLRGFFLGCLAAVSALDAEIVEIHSTISTCGDDPVFCFGELGECKGLVSAEGEVIRRFHQPFDILGP